MISTTHGRAYELFRQIHAKALQLEIQMMSLSNVIASSYSGNYTQEQAHRHLTSLSDHVSKQIGEYVSGAQELCRLIKECQKVLQEEN